MIKVAVVTTVDNWGRQSLSTRWGYIEPGEVAALEPLRSQEVDGTYVAVTRVVLKSGQGILVAATPEEINDDLAC